MGVQKSDPTPWITVLKGGCILLVVLYHAVLPGYAETLRQLSAGQEIARLWILLNQSLSPLRMPAFFFVSGLLAARAIQADSWRQVVSGRLTNLLYLYVLWGSIQWLSISGIVHGVNDAQYSLNSNAMYAASVGEFVSLMSKAMSPSWYLYALALFFLLARLFQRQNMALLAVATGLSYAAQLGLIAGWGPQSLARYLLFFLIGAFFSPSLIRLSEGRRDNLPWWIGLAALALMHALLGLEHSVMLCLLAVAGSIALCRQLSRGGVPRWLQRAGQQTLQIYVLHRIFIELFGTAAIQFAQRQRLFDSPAFSLLWASAFPVLLLLLCVGCSLGCGGLLNRGMGRALFIWPRRAASAANQPGQPR
ncbi:acyltransferase family protein [Pantoea sp. 1.19]|uniref:acyltransferase family protein n=1 Tax=Pantoea sp. 1.19 TaxID=1925589 RepID=UPI000948C68C|nr:acyltransferase family protein [Pantoea sp. 1.19]